MCEVLRHSEGHEVFDSTPNSSSVTGSERSVRLRLSATRAWLCGFGVTTTAPSR